MRHIFSIIVSMKNILPLLLLWAPLLSGCAITNSYGPIEGKVIDRETGDPIYGGIVVGRVYTSVLNPYGSYDSFAGAWEAITNEKGEYSTPFARAWAFRPISVWRDAKIRIIKKGYKDDVYTIPPYFANNKYVTSALEKNEKKYTLEDRRRDLPRFSHEIDKLYVLSQIIDQEKIKVKLSPSHVERYWRKKGFLSENEETISKDYWKPREPRLRGPIQILPLPSLPKMDANGSRPLEAYNKIYGYKYEIFEYKDEILKELKEKGIAFEEKNGFVLLSHIYMEEVGKIIDAIYNKPHIIFINTEYGNIFLKLLEENTIPFEVRTIPHTVGYDIRWDDEYDQEVENIKYKFYQKIIDN